MIDLGHRHNALGLTASVTPRIDDFNVHINNAVRPYPVLNAQEFCNATIDSIVDPGLRRLPRIGSIDQLTHADDMTINFTTWRQALAQNYRDMLKPPAEI